jgi:hypothetical protein
VWGEVVGQKTVKGVKALVVKVNTLTKAPAPSCVSAPEYTGSSTAPAK